MDYLGHMGYTGCSGYKGYIGYEGYLSSMGYMGLCPLHELQVNFGSVQKCSSGYFISLNHLGNFLPNLPAIPSVQT